MAPSTEGVSSFDIVYLDREDLKRLLPHSGEALVLDGVSIHAFKKQALGYFHVGGPNLQVFRGHFPSNPVMAGHWLLEFACLTSAALALCLSSEDAPPKGEKRRGVRLIGFNGKIRFRREAQPGEELLCDTTITSEQKNFVYFKAKIVKLEDLSVEICTIPEIIGVSFRQR